MQAQASESSDVGGVMLSGDDRAEYMGWIIDDFPGTAEQVRLTGCKHGKMYITSTTYDNWNAKQSNMVTPSCQTSSNLQTFVYTVIEPLH